MFIFRELLNERQDCLNVYLCLTGLLVFSCNSKLEHIKLPSYGARPLAHVFSAFSFIVVF